MAVEMADSGADIALLRAREALPATKRRTRWASTFAEMVGKDLVLRKEGAVNLRELAARTTLSEVRQKGHTYVELRQVGKRTIFFCTLCLTPCFNDNVLFDHLQGNLHARRLAAAKVTLFGPDPWPFSDGVLFFNSSKEEKPLLMSGSQNDMALVVSERTSANGEEVSSKFIGAVDSNSNGITSDLGRNGDHEICIYNGESTHGSSNCNDKGAEDVHKSVSRSTVATTSKNGHDRTLHGREMDCRLTIPGVLVEEQVSDLSVWSLGIGQIAYRTCESNDAHGKISKIWCAWLGLGDSNGSDESKKSPDCDFAVVNFSYSEYLGRKSAWEDQGSPISPGSYFEIDHTGHRGKKRKKSFSDQECSSEDLTDRGEFPAEDCSGLDSCAADSSQQLQMRLIPSKAVRQELRKQNRLAAEKTCDICRQPMLPGKDVATLLNLRTGSLACSSRNSKGAFHIFHASCLIHWILLCELEMLTNQSSNTRPTRGRKGRMTTKNRISSVFCPECQGTGIHIQGEEFERPKISLAEMFLYKLKAIEAQKAWMKNPEVLNKCSTGLHFPSETVEDSQEKVVPLKLLHFYRSDE